MLESSSVPVPEPEALEPCSSSTTTSTTLSVILPDSPSPQPTTMNFEAGSDFSPDFMDDGPGSKGASASHLPPVGRGKVRMQFLNRPNVQNGGVKVKTVRTLTTATTASNINDSNDDIHLPPPSAPPLLQDPSNSRPPFITTVTRGKFLPSKFDLFLEKQLFTFSSRPRPIGFLAKQQQCSLYGSAAGTRIPALHHAASKPRGIHDYYNLMWDPHIRRGNTAGATKTANEQEEKPKAVLSGRTKRSTMTTSTPRNVIFSSSKKKQVKVDTPPPFKNLFHSTVQTDVFLEDLSLADHVLEVDKVVQTDLLLEQPLPSCIVPVKTGVDASTQILPGELIDFEEEVQPIVSTLVAKVLEQAFLETIEEEELAALKEQQNRFQEKMKEEQRQLRALQEQHERLTAEKERLEKNLKDQPKEVEELCVVAGAVYSTTQVMELLPSVLNSLRQEGYIQDGSNATSPILALSLPNVGPDAGGSTESSETAEIPENQDTSEKLELGIEDAKSSEEPWTALENLEKEITEERGNTKLAEASESSL